MAANQPNSDNSNENLRIVVEKNPSESRLSELGIKFWPKWACSPGKYQLMFEAQETCYLVKGKVRAYAKKEKSSTTTTTTQEEEEYVEFGGGDLVIIPKGLSCTWDVSLPVDKFYKFDSSSSNNHDHQ